MVQQLPRAAKRFSNETQLIKRRVLREVDQAWRAIGDELDAGWPVTQQRIVSAVGAGQVALVQSANAYVPVVVDELDIKARHAGFANPARFVGVAGNGGALSSLYLLALIETKKKIGQSGDYWAGWGRGHSWLNRVTSTVLADTSRAAVSATMGASVGVAGYVRVLNPPSCSRCLILAGKWYRYNQGFQRHPQCDCAHLPAAEHMAGEFIDDPYDYFFSLSEADQNRLLGEVDAQAVRDGADIYRVVNIRARGLGTAKGNRRYGTPHTLTIDDIYAAAGGSRQRAIDLMREHGFLLDVGQVPGGAIFGPMMGAERRKALDLALANAA